MSERLFRQLLDCTITDARIGFTGSASFIVGRAANGSGPKACDVVLRVHRDRLFSRVLCYGNLGLGESFMDQDFEMEHGSLHELLTILLRNRLDQKLKKDPRLLLQIVGVRLVNAFYGKEQNNHRHYDLGDDLFESFLDSTLTYTCGYICSPDDDLERMQANKLDRICRKLRLEPGQRLLDLGCGYGGLLIHAARNYGVTGVGVTNSVAHCRRGQANAEQAGVNDRVQIQYKDYNHAEGVFDRVVSVGLMEHLPHREYTSYMRKIGASLADHGIGLIHTIGCNWFKNEHDPFTQKYIFPGSRQARLSEITTLLERNRLAILDVENIRQHYGYTVLRWLDKFRRNQASLDPIRYDGRFCRMWEYYFACGIAAAFASNSAVFQVLFTKDYSAAVPLHRV